MSKKNKKDPSRRQFLIKGLNIAAGTILGGGILAACTKEAKTGEKGEKVKVLTADGKLMEVDRGHALCCNVPTAKEVRKGIPGRHFVMVIDLSRCRNARACVSACNKMHFLEPGHEWMKVFLMQDSDDTSPYWMPKPCFHCDAPPCVNVCPVGASFKREDGVVLIDNERCIGCKFCMAACPYSSRVFNWKEPGNKVGANYSPETGVPQRKGTVGKCDFCPDSFVTGILPDCVTACPNGVYFFGDKNEDVVTNGQESFRFSELVRDKAAYRYMEELGTRPNVYYLPPVDRRFPVKEGFEDVPDSVKKAYQVKRAHLKKFKI
jgi:molybdopterin-containing oxidoreductase family iron-sulfur binding subunit